MDLLPEEIKFICRLCHIAANKRMVDKLECSNIAVEGKYCKHVEKIRSVLRSQASELTIYRKYITAFMNDKLAERTVFQKNELAAWYKEKIEEGERSLEEFLELLRHHGAEIVGG